MPSVKKIKKYSIEDMQHALDAVRRGVSVSSASKQYKIPRITLLYKAKGKYAVNCRMGPETTLTSIEEDLLVKWLLSIADAGFPATRVQLLDSVQIIMQKLDRPNKFKNNRPGKKWFRCFLNRHPQLSERLTQNLTKSRSEVNEEKLRKWFDEIKDYVKSKKLEDVFEDPKRIFNTDETAFFLSPKGIKCLVRKGDKTAYNFINNDEKECLTTLITANAAGMLVPPMVMFNYERIPAHISNLMPQEWGIGKSESGWMNGQSFYEFVPVALFVDGHSSHLTMELSNFCVENQIELIALYPNATHILQPLDVSVFHPLKNGWKKGIQKFKMDNEGRKLKRENFGPLLKVVMEQSIKPDIITNGFRTCGLFPLDANGIPYHKYFKKVENIPTSNTRMDDTFQTTTKILQFLEHKIDEEKIKSFRESGEPWQGDIEDTSLYTLWRKLTSEVNESNIGQVDKVHEAENVIEGTNHVDTVPACQDVINETMSNDISELPIAMEEKTPEKRAVVILDNVLNLTNFTNVPSPFKSSLFWPKPIISNKPKRSKEKVPSVATSEQWRTYHKKKQENKENKEREKEEHKNKPKKTTKRKQTPRNNEDEFSSDSSIEITFESEGEGDDWAERSSFEDYMFRDDDYVIIKYDDSYYPGKIKETNIDGSEFRVSAMEKSGILNWKWPDHEDIMWYQENDLVKRIKSPTPKNDRGIFSIPEMKGYSSIFYKL
ncbi:hypothetical protein NQ314_010178 [Rhamnusium bicolor]|uniref:HTH CENPB-type domain-containing protein n=1 Tax=Rhamnusium bicolor TaxID=1586634 RepID=A0AAV8XSJ8_9CUCU|nr:hypothetical protein NQ314_010178 [Rhamnusium bicolor]